MMISPLQAQFQIWMAKAVGAKRGKCLTSLTSPSIGNSSTCDGTFKLSSTAIFRSYFTFLSFVYIDRASCVCKLIEPDNPFLVLEIGCFVGFSGMGWSHAVGVDGYVTTPESNAKYATVARDTFHKNGIKNIEVIIGDAQES